MQPSIGLLDAGYSGSFYLEVVLGMMCVPCTIIRKQDICSPRIEGCSTLVFGAGGIYPSRTALAGPAGKERLRALIYEGRTYVGICSGAYLAFHAPLCLGIADITPEYPMAEHLFQGFLSVRTDGGVLPMWYQNGPVFPPDLGTARAVACFDQHQHSAEADPANRLTPADFRSRPAIVRGRYGKGHYVLLSAHPELGSLGVPGYLPLLESWRRRHALGLVSGRVPCGRARRQFLAHAVREATVAGKAGYREGPLAPLVRETNGPQWRFLKDLLLAGQGA